jgi:cytochrome b
MQCQMMCCHVLPSVLIWESWQRQLLMIPASGQQREQAPTQQQIRQQHKRQQHEVAMMRPLAQNPLQCVAVLVAVAAAAVVGVAAATEVAAVVLVARVAAQLLLAATPTRRPWRSWMAVCVMICTRC